MKIFISVDMEGLAGTFKWSQEDAPGKGEVRRNMTEQLSWIIEGIQGSTANPSITEITIADSHGSGDTLLYDFTARDDRIRLISGTPRQSYMMTGLTRKHDAVFMVGYHGGRGMAASCMDHTYSSRSIQSLSINGRLMNEAILNAAYAGNIGVPVSLITGDSGLKKQLSGLKALQHAVFVVTKESLGRFSVKHKALGLLQKETVKAVTRALDPKNRFPVYSLKQPYVLSIELVNTAMADYVALMPGIKRKNGHTVESRHRDYETVFNAVSAITLLAAYGRQN